MRSYPFARLLAAFATGIVFQWYFAQNFISLAIIFFSLICVVGGFRFLPESKKFIYGWLQGIFYLLIFLLLGMMITWQQNVKNNKDWYEKKFNENDKPLFVAKLQEPIVNKTNSYKALATVEAVYKGKSFSSAKGNILVYFKKELLKPTVQYGSVIIFAQPIQYIQNSGNPSSFNYNRYCLFQNITGQVFLSDKDYKISPLVNKNPLQQMLFNIRDWSLNVLQQNIHSPRELGIAEALLIGYRNDLDKDLVQAYSNTGVVHIIAISGLHIGVIYGALIWFFGLLKSYKLKKWIEPILILIIIWLFTLVAGAAPSVLRASVMFTFILIGKFFGKTGNMYNTLAASAFVILIINPFYLWDVGFQLSYSAVFSIVLFYKKISGLLYFKNKSLRWIWQLCAVSLSAQIFTAPLIMYHFHQLPTLFLFSNLVAVPLSGIILFEELLLFLFAWCKSFATCIGWFTEICIKCMNDFVQHIDKISFSVWDGLHISIIQLFVLFAIITSVSLWIFNKNNKPLFTSLGLIILFLVLRNADIIYHKSQQKLIVYNVPKHKAIDFIAGGSLRFAGDSTVLTNPFLRNFHLKSSRIKNRVYNNENILLPDIQNIVLNIHNSKILALGQADFQSNRNKKLPLDLLILSSNTKQTPAEINDLFRCNYIVADGSVPVWKSAKWKKEFEQLHLRFFSVAQNGAFTLKL